MGRKLIHYQQLYQFGTENKNISVASGSSISTSAVKISTLNEDAGILFTFPYAKSGPASITYQLSIDGLSYYTPAGSDGAADTTINHKPSAATYYVFRPYLANYIRFNVNAGAATCDDTTCNAVYFQREEA